MYVNEVFTTDGQPTRVFNCVAGNHKPSDEDPYIAIPSPAKFASVTAPDGVDYSVKKSGSWTYLRLNKSTGANIFQGGPEKSSLIPTYLPGEDIVTFSLRDAESFIGKNKLGAISYFEGQKQDVRFSPAAPPSTEPIPPSPWDPLDPTNPK